MTFETSLLREKFVIRDLLSEMDESSPAPIIALSNRMVVELRADGGAVERYVVRGHNMHSCVRMAARIVHNFEILGPLQERVTPFGWGEAWTQVIADFEAPHNPQRWIAVYAHGKPLYVSGERHPFLDVIEKCDAHNKGVYEKSIPLAEEAFKASGKAVEIHYDSNVAMTMKIQGDEARCGIIMRGPRDTTMFKFTALADGAKRVNIAQCLGAAAAFLEGLQLCYVAGINTEKIKRGLIEHASREGHKTRESERRIGRLRVEINNLENAYTVHYRPEKPDFAAILAEAENMAQVLLGR